MRDKKGGASVLEKIANWKNGIKQQLSRPSFKEATKEVAITVGTATLPIWFFPLMGLICSVRLDHSIF